MTEIFKKIVAFMTAMLLTFTGLFTNWNKSPKVNMDSLASFGTYSSTQGESYTIKSDSPVTVNTMVLCEKGNNIKGFTLEALTDDGYILVTKGDTVGTYRYSKFDDVTAKEFKVTITDYDSSFKIKSTKLGNIKTENSDFKVCSYMVVSDLTADYEIEEEKFLSTTDLIIFGVCRFDEKGEITCSNMENVSALMAKVREINPEIRIHLNMLGPTTTVEGDWDASQVETGKLHACAMRDNRDKFIENIISVLDEYDFDGVHFDWEYPTTVSLKLMFSTFLINLDYALGERELGVALASWCSALTPMAIHAIDNVEVMAYDLFDYFGYHAAFTSSYDAIDEMLRNGYSASQLHLGLAFYARPTDAGSYWFNYNEKAETLGYYDNVCDVEYDGKVMESYFNSAQLTRDKTAYALDRGLGGVMLWHLSCDTSYSSDLSLFRAINTAISKDV